MAGWAEAEGCPGGWISIPFHTHVSCYNFVTSPTAKWSEAQGVCRDMGGHLATLDSLEEIIWIKGYRSHYVYLHKDMWIGGYKKDGKWLWKGDISDSAIVITDWAKYQPDNWQGNQNCLRLWGSEISESFHNDPKNIWYRFDDAECDMSMPFICEKHI